MSLAALRQETLALLAAGEYVATKSRQVVHLRTELLHSFRGSTCHLEGTLGSIEITSSSGIARTKFEVTDEKTHWAVERLASEQDSDASGVLLLNFANGQTPGGSYLRDSPAQEEDLCRSSGLYTCLLADAAQPYYHANGLATAPPQGIRGVWSSDAVIHTPAVPFFRGLTAGALLDRLLLPSVLTCAAPMLSCSLPLPPETQRLYEQAILQRVRALLTVAALHEHQTLVLGAWGCGAFGNDPEIVARSFHRVLTDSPLAGRFQRVVFACFGPQANRQEFVRLFSPAS